MASGPTGAVAVIPAAAQSDLHINRYRQEDMNHLVIAFALMAITVAIHLLGGLAVVLLLRHKISVEPHQSLLRALRIVVELFAALLLLHLIQVGVWAAMYQWQIGWDFDTAIYFSTVTYATIGYGDVVPPPEWRLVAATEGLTGVLMLGWSSAMIYSLVSRLLDTTKFRRPDEGN